MSDSEDEVLDWANVSTASINAGVLKRGEKDHAPDGTMVQQSTLQRSREAMYTALSVPASTALKHLIECDWDAENRRGIVRKVKGSHFKSIGWAERTTTYVFPEELIYLVQRGSMVCFYKNKPLAIDGVMALVLPSISIDFLLVYMHLKRLGYAVRRASFVQNSLVPLETNAVQLNSSNPPLTSSLVMLVAGPWLSNLAWRPFYTSYGSIYRDLQWVQPAPNSPSDSHEFDFYVWKPSTEFKRSKPPTPDFQIRIVSADMPMPVMRDITAGLQAVEPRPSTKRSPEEKMSQGIRNFIYAVVDNGVVSFVRVTDSPVESLY